MTGSQDGLDGLQTPCLLLDEGKLSANLAGMRAQVERHGVTDASRGLAPGRRQVFPAGRCVSPSSLVRRLLSTSGEVLDADLDEHRLRRPHQGPLGIGQAGGEE